MEFGYIVALKTSLFKSLNVDQTIVVPTVGLLLLTPS